MAIKCFLYTNNVNCTPSGKFPEHIISAHNVLWEQVGPTVWFENREAISLLWGEPGGSCSQILFTPKKNKDFLFSYELQTAAPALQDRIWTEQQKALLYHVNKLRCYKSKEFSCVKDDDFSDEMQGRTFMVGGWWNLVTAPQPTRLA